MDTQSDDVAGRLAEIEVQDTEGRAMSLGSLWAERPAVLVFVRHFG